MNYMWGSQIRRGAKPGSPAMAEGQTICSLLPSRLVMIDNEGT